MAVAHHTVPGVADPGVPHVSVAAGRRTLFEPWALVEFDVTAVVD